MPLLAIPALAPAIASSVAAVAFLLRSHNRPAPHQLARVGTAKIRAVLSWLIGRRRSREALEQPADVAPYADPPHRWEAAVVYQLNDAQAATLEAYRPPGAGYGWRYLRVAGPRCRSCGEDWHPAIALMPCAGRVS